MWASDNVWQRIRACALVVVAVVALGACGGNQDREAATRTAPATSAPSSLAPATSLQGEDEREIGALLACEPSGDGRPSPLAHLVYEELFSDEAFQAQLGALPSYSQSVVIMTGKAEMRSLSRQWASGTAVQVASAGGGQRNGWSEFHWEDPLWSDRDGSSPEWQTRNEPGAFEPPYQISFVGLHILATSAAVSPGLDPVHERSAGPGVEVFCADASDMEGSENLGLEWRGVVRFVAAEGFATEAVTAMVSDDGDTVCIEARFDQDATIELPGLRDADPIDWSPFLEHLDSCRPLTD